MFRTMVSLLLLLPVLIPSLGSAQEPTINPSKELVLGKAGNRYISEEEFVRRFELLPGLYRQKEGRLDEEKLVVMYSLIAEKLLAQEAEENGLAADSTTVHGLHHLEELLARDELYREEVSDKVTVTRAEIQTGVREALRTIFARYLFFANKSDAEFIATQVKGKNLRTFTVDSTIPSIKDTVTIEYGEAEPEIEKAAYALKTGEISSVIPTSKGFLILQRVSDSPSARYLGMQPRVLEKRVATHIRLVKEEERLRSFVGKFLREQTGYAVGPKIKALALATQGLLERSGTDSLYYFVPGAADSLRDRLASVLDDTFMVAGARAYPVRETIAMLTGKDPGFESDDPLVVAGAVNAQCRVWVEQELLGQEAIRRGLDRGPAVQSQMNEWRDAYLAQRMRSAIASKVTLTDADVYRYLQKYGDPLPTPRVRIRQLTTATIEEMRLAMAALDKGMPFAQVIQQYSKDPGERSREGLSDFFPITERPPLGELAGQMAPGEFYGPMPTASGIVFFQLVARQDSVARDSAMAKRKEQTTADLRRMLVDDAVEKSIAAAAAKLGYSVFADRLQMIKVSPIPMMSFRVLGFGGRLFAAPLLPRLFHWVTMEVPKPAVAP